jgi:hypothetical protein
MPKKKKPTKPFLKAVTDANKIMRKAQRDIKKKTTRREDVNQAAARIVREATET